MWRGRPDAAIPIPGGCPRYKKALVAKLVYPKLMFRVCLYLGGHTYEEMDVVVDDKYTWRTKCRALKDELNDRIKQWPKLTRVVGRNKGVTNLKEILEPDQPDRVEKVFGKDKVELLEKFLADAEEREPNPEKQKAKRKRPTVAGRSRESNQVQQREMSEVGSSDEETDDEDDDDQQPTPKKLRAAAPQPPQQILAGIDNGDKGVEGYDPMAMAAMAQPRAAAVYGGSQDESPMAAMQFQLQHQQAAAPLLGERRIRGEDATSAKHTSITTILPKHHHLISLCARWEISGRGVV